MIEIVLKWGIKNTAKELVQNYQIHISSKDPSNNGKELIVLPLWVEIYYADKRI